MENDRIKWDDRYQKAPDPRPPSKLIQDYLPHARQGKALDLACGTGRNSLYLAQNHFRVDSVDISGVAIRELKKHNHPGIHAICRDLDDWQIPKDQYDLILSIKFMARNLFPGMIKGVRAGGIVMIDAFVAENKRPYCLMKNELLTVFKGFEILFHVEAPLPGHGKYKKAAQFVARKK